MVNHTKKRVNLVLFLIGICAAASALTGSFAFADTFEFVTKWGTTGSGDGQFSNPDGIDNYDTGLYVTDQNNNRVQKFTLNGLFQSVLSGTTYNHPAGIFGDAGNYILYVADKDSNQIQKLNLSGSVIKVFGGYGTADGQFDHPYGVARMPPISGLYQSKIYVVDTGNNRIQTFSTSGTTVTFFAKWGSGGAGNGQFNSPRGIAIEATGYVYIADYNNNRVQKFDPDGTFLTAWGSPGSGNSQFNGPYNMSIDQNGAVYVTDTNNHRVQKFDANGVFIGAWGSYGTGDGQFNNPKGVYVYNNGTTSSYVFVVDSGNNRVQKFHVSIGAASTTTTTPGGVTTTTPGGVTTTTPGGVTTTTPGGVTTTTITIPTFCTARKVLGDESPDLEKLRIFRDGTLAQSAVGRKIIRIYYDNADSINDAIDRSPALKEIARKGLEVIASMAGEKEE